MDTKLLGKNLRRGRKRLGLTQEKFAELLDVSPHYVYELEQGLKLPSLQTLVSAAHILHLSTDDLLNADEIPARGDDKLGSLIGSLTAGERDGLYRVLKSTLPYLRL